MIEIEIRSPMVVRFDRDWNRDGVDRVIQKLRLIHSGFRVESVQNEPFTNWVTYESPGNIEPEALACLGRLTSRYEYLIRRELGVSLAIRRGK